MLKTSGLIEFLNLKLYLKNQKTFYLCHISHICQFWSIFLLTAGGNYFLVNQDSILWWFYIWVLLFFGFCTKLFIRELPINLLIFDLFLFSYHIITLIRLPKWRWTNAQLKLAFSCEIYLIFFSFFAVLFVVVWHIMDNDRS